jgi:hypothetical protein
LAKRIGYKSHAGIYKRFPSLAREITSRHRSHITYTRQSYETVKAALESALESAEIDSLGEVARMLGYDEAAVLSQRFPVLSAAVKKKCHQRRKAKDAKATEEMHAALLSALNEQPPPALNVLARRLGYKASGRLRDRFPDLCKVISARFLESRRSRKYGKERILKAALKENPAPSMREIAKRVGVVATVLSQQFPELAGQISKRHKEQKRERERLRQKELKGHIRAAMLELSSNGVYPSRSQISARVPIGATSRLLTRLLKEIRLEGF